jgi:hypothetical protein
MAIKIRKAQLASEPAVVAAINALIDARLTTQVHRDKTSTPAGDSLNPSSATLQVTAANASNLATSLTLVTNLKGVLAVHCADTSAHLVADTTNDAFDGYAAASDLATAIALANAIKVDYTAHIANTSVHLNADSTNTVAASAATDQSSLNTLLNELKTDINAHINLAGSVQRLVLVDD